MVEYVKLADAADLIPSGASIGIGGFTLYRRPVEFIKALLRRSPRPSDLKLLTFTAGYESDLLVGAGCVACVRTVYFGLESFGLAPMFTQAAQDQAIEIIEETEASIVMGLRAQMSGVGYLPSHAWIGTDLPRLRPDVKVVDDPYHHEELTAFPAISLDFAILHGVEADAEGNVRLNNNLGIDLELVYVADMVIVTVERMVDRVTKTADSMLVPAPGADIVAVAPRGAFPCSCHPLYPVGGGELLRYVDACTDGEFEQYLNNSLSLFSE